MLTVHPNSQSIFLYYISGKIALNNLPAINVSNIFVTIDYDVQINEKKRLNY